MATEWFQSRKHHPMSATSREIRLYLLPAEWYVFDRVCAEKEWSRGRMAATIVKAWCVERLALDVQQRVSDDVKRDLLAMHRESER